MKTIKRKNQEIDLAQVNMNVELNLIGNNRQIIKLEQVKGKIFHLHKLEQSQHPTTHQIHLLRQVVLNLGLVLVKDQVYKLIL